MYFFRKVPRRLLLIFLTPVGLLLSLFPDKGGPREWFEEVRNDW